MVHVLKNIMIPVVTVIGLELGNMIAFAVVTETIFAWPGMGKLMIDSISLLDRPVIVAYLMIIVLMFIVINLVVDVLYSVLDPRVRLVEAQGMKQAALPATAQAPREAARPRAPLARAWREFTDEPVGGRRPGRCSPLIAAIALLAPWISPQNPYDLPSSTSWTATCRRAESRRPATPTGSAPTTRAATCCRAILYGLRIEPRRRRAQHA